VLQKKLNNVHKSGIGNGKARLETLFCESFSSLFSMLTLLKSTLKTIRFN
jgi:hypothetical protein